jgi:uncharacterized protein YkwD
MVENHATAPARAARRSTTLIAALVAACMLLLGLAATASARLDRAERATIHAINHVRHRHGLHGVRISGRMCTGADAHSRFMARHNYATHGAWAARVSRYAHSRTIGEILGWVAGGHQVGTIMSMWMHSSGHRAVILNGAYRRVGIGRRRGYGHTFYTVDFAR